MNSSDSMRRYLLVSVTSILAACSSGDASIAPQAVAPKAEATAPVKLSLVVPAKIRMMAAGDAISSAHRSTKYVAPTTLSLKLTFTPSSGAGSIAQTFPCTASGCVALFHAPVGAASVALALTDGAGGSGASLSLTNSTPVVIASGITNMIHLTANPVVDHVSLSLAAAPVAYGGTPVDVPLTLNVMDADSNIIVGPGSYVDANGNTVTIQLAAVDSKNGGAGTASITGTTSITAPGQNPVALHYDGNWLDHTTVTATTTSSAVNTSGATVTLTTVPHATEYPAGGSPHGIAAGPDGNIWFAEFNGQAIGKMTPSGEYTEYSCAPTCSTPHYITAGPDGNLWFTDFFGGWIDKMTTAGAFSEIYAIGAPVRIRTGPDGNIWFASASAQLIGKLATDGTSIANYPLGSTVRGFEFASDGSLWFSASLSTLAEHVSSTGGAIAAVGVDNLGGNPDGVAIDETGTVWMTNNGDAELEKISGGSAIPIPLGAGTAPRDIVVGKDNNLWFTDSGTGTIGYIAPNSTTPTILGAAVGISATSNPTGITVGPDGNIWVAEFGTNSIAKFVW